MVPTEKTRKIPFADMIPLNKGEKIARTISSETGIIFAYKHGKTSAREVRFADPGHRITAGLTSEGESYYGRKWLVWTEDGSCIGLFDNNQIIGVWTDDAATAMAVRQDETS